MTRMRLVGRRNSVPELTLMNLRSVVRLRWSCSAIAAIVRPLPRSTFVQNQIDQARTYLDIQLQGTKQAEVVAHVHVQAIEAAQRAEKVHYGQMANDFVAEMTASSMLTDSETNDILKPVGFWDSEYATVHIITQEIERL